MRHTHFRSEGLPSFTSRRDFLCIDLLLTQGLGLGFLEVELGAGFLCECFLDSVPSWMGSRELGEQVRTREGPG